MIDKLENLNVAELLGRRPLTLDLGTVHPDIAERRIIVTGAAGSIGAELCRYILRCAPGQLICVDRAETGLFYLRQELLRAENGGCTTYAIADIRDPLRMANLLSEHRPEIIFHAAAYKHVCMVESNVSEALNNNVLGVLSLLEMSEVAGAERFVFISSDKAVNPTSVMGATKRICESILCARPSAMRCTSLRFGNVLGSSGSVVPVLWEQLCKGQPLTITHPGMKRYFMAIQEAVVLVLQAAAIGTGRDILVLDMGEAMRVTDLAHRLIRLSGKPERDVEIRFTGIRRGEKLEEDLFYAFENAVPTMNPHIRSAHGPVPSWRELSRQLGELRICVSSNGVARIRAKIKEIVPEYCPVDDVIPALETERI